MNEKLKYKNYGEMVDAQPPLMTTIGGAAKSGLDTAKKARDLVKEEIKVTPVIPLFGPIAAATANTLAEQGANFMTGFTGQQHTPNKYKAVTFGDLINTAPKIGAPAAIELNPRKKDTPQVNSNKAAPVSVPTIIPKYVEDTTSDLAKFRRAQMGEFSPQTPAIVNVARQPNGTLSFSATGGGNTLGQVMYAGVPNWTSHTGGAGAGSVDFSGDAFKAAKARAELERQNPFLSQVQRYMSDIENNVGGAAGVARTKLNLANLQEIMKLIENEKISAMQLAQQKYATDVGAKSDAARTAAVLSGQAAQERVAAAQIQAQKEGAESSAAARIIGRQGTERKALEAARLAEFINRMVASNNPQDRALGVTLLGQNPLLFQTIMSNQERED